MISRLQKFRHARQPTAERNSRPTILEYQPPGADQKKLPRHVPLIITVLVEWVVVPLLLIAVALLALWLHG